MNRTLLIASLLLMVAAAATQAARYGEGEGLNPGAEGAKPTDSGSTPEKSDPGFSGVNNAAHTGVNGGQAATGTYGKVTKK